MSDTEQTSRIGINAVEAIFLDMGWIFREQPTSDFGVDAQAEIKVGKQATGRLIALQIKAGASYFKKRGENFVYYGSREHLEYWTIQPSACRPPWHRDWKPALGTLAI